jgi:predicted peptidase
MAAAAGAGFCAPAAFAAQQETGFLDRSVSLGGETYRYPVFIPANWQKKQKWPVILFLHGAGERGRNGLFSSDIGLGRAIRRSETSFPFIVAFPQCREDRLWHEPDMEAVALAAIDATVREFSGDKDRVYMTGLSMGGYGTWDIAAQYPKRFSAIAPICGGIRLPAPVQQLSTRHTGPAIPAAGDAEDPYAAVAKRIGKTPVWVFHGALDTTILPEESRLIVAALKAAGGNVRYSEYEGIGHNSWDRAYAEPEFFPWLLSHKRQ